ncbi:MAG: folate family ECF transporter S component [Clostridiales bacterium]|nr:folate family ECF transporter S component [Clostridiales bacterium]
MVQQQKRNIALKQLVVLAILIALSVILERFLGYNDRILSISFGYLPIVLAAIVYGPFSSMVVSIVADVLGALLFPSGPLDPRFTLIAAAKGLLYGLFLNREDAQRGSAALSQALVTVVCHLTLNTLVISDIIGRGFWAILPLRVLKNLLFYPIEVLTIIKLLEYRKTFERLAK